MGALSLHKKRCRSASNDNRIRPENWFQEILLAPIEEEQAELSASMNLRAVVNSHHFQLLCMNGTEKHGSDGGGWSCFLRLEHGGVVCLKGAYRDLHWEAWALPNAFATRTIAWI
jgi:hypothetical protein